MPGRDTSSNSIRFQGVDPNGDYKLPADPWVLRVRWKKDGMYCFRSAASPLTCIDLRRQSLASLNSAAGSVSAEMASPPRAPHPKMEPIDNVVMHLDIQLYEMEPGVYLVDFKCAGYENAEGLLLEEKDVTSPFPFLDLASKLIIQLAEAD